MGRSVLLLNASWEPLRIVSWQKSIELWYLDKIEIIKEYTDFVINSTSISLNCPAVIKLRKYVKQFQKSKLVKFSRLHVYARDNYTCSYCHQKFSIKKLTLDHVIPKSRFTSKEKATTWSNVVTACLECNYKKSNRSPEEAKMRLNFVPKEPNVFTANLFSIKNQKIPNEWVEFLRE